MAAELRSPLLPPGPQRRRGLALAVAAAAPLLALLLAVVVFSRSLLTVSSPEPVDLTLVAGAREKGAAEN
nr:unnamed protein product [Digitaria exilis]